MKKQDKAMVLSTSNRIGTIILYLMHIFNVFVLIYKGSRKTLQWIWKKIAFLPTELIVVYGVMVEKAENT